MMSIFTIGFTKSTAQRFFSRLSVAGVKRVIDVRLHNTSQLSGFAKADDLAFFLREICSAEYVYRPDLAPTDEMLKEYKRDGGNWETYRGRFLDLMRDRKIEAKIDPELLDGSCLLCSESAPHHCHRRLVCDYLDERWPGLLKINHI